MICPEIETCNIERNKIDFDYFCMKHPEFCRKHTVEKTPKEWKASL